MSLFYNLREGVFGAINYVVDKNRKISLVNHIKTIIRNEERNANQAYIALGKYYFNHHRDPENSETEFYCLEVDSANRRMSRAMMKLDELTDDEAYIYDYENEDYDGFCMGCDESCDTCGCYEGMNPGTDWDNVTAMNQMRKELDEAARIAENPDDLDEEELEVELDETLQEYLDNREKLKQEEQASGKEIDPDDADIL